MSLDYNSLGFVGERNCVLTTDMVGVRIVSPPALKLPPERYLILAASFTIFGRSISFLHSATFERTWSKAGKI